MIVAAAAAWGLSVFGHANAKPAAMQAATTPAGRNDVRRGNLKLMADALSQYLANVGPLPVAVPSHQTAICASSSKNCKAAGEFDPIFLISAGYLSAAPSDPSGGRDRYGTGYTIGRNAAGQIELQAPRAEAGAVITQTVQ